MHTILYAHRAIGPTGGQYVTHHDLGNTTRIFGIVHDIMHDEIIRARRAWRHLRPPIEVRVVTTRDTNLMVDGIQTRIITMAVLKR